MRLERIIEAFPYQIRERNRKRRSYIHRDVHRCAAKCRNQGAIEWRASQSEDPLCQAPATIPLRTPFGERWFCYQHARVYRVHYGIVDRITGLPTR